MHETRYRRTPAFRGSSGHQNLKGYLALISTCLLLQVAQAQPSSPPTLSWIPDQGVYPGGTNRLIAFTIGDPDSQAQQLTVSGVSANTSLVPNSGLIFGGSKENRTLSIIPAPGQMGTTAISVMVEDPQGGITTNTFILDVNWFTPVPSGLPVMNQPRTAWGDYDNDGYPDLALSGYADGLPVARVYHNNQDGTFTNADVGLQSNAGGKTAWGDYDRDGDLDLLVTDSTNRLYRNDGNGTFSPVATDLPYSSGSEAAWGDFDNNGAPDVMLSGTGLFQNKGDGTFSPVAAILPPASSGSTEWGDFDNDGDLDFVLTGRTQSHISEVFRNDGQGAFAPIADFTGVYLSGSRWGDYDNDGDLDLLITGGIGDVDRLGRIYRNNGDQTFTDINAGLAGVTLSSAAWGDFDNDGYLDAVISGMSTNSASFTGLYRNNHNQTFTLIAAGLTNVQYGSASWADVDQDGDLDLLVAGFASPYGTPTLQLYRNNAPTNTLPAAPTSLSAAVLSNGVVALTWLTATDAQTPSAGLTYNLRVGTAPGAGDVFGPQADAATGVRQMPQFTGMQTNAWRIRDLPKGTYYWSAQAIDTAFAGSPFSVEQTFVITNTPPTIQVAGEVRVGPSMTTTLPFTVTDAESPATQLAVTAQSLNDAFIPSPGIIVQGTGAQRAVSFTVGAGQMGTNDLVLRATDPSGSFREASVRVVSEMFTAQPIPESTNYQSLDLVKIGWGYPYDGAMVDVDHDGDLDVLMRGSVLSNNYVVPVFVIASNGGLGNFSFNIVSNPAVALTASSYWFDDFNHDGNVDLLSVYDSANNGSVQLLPGDGAGRFAPGQGVGSNRISFFADLDNDGDLDGLELASDTSGLNSRLNYYDNAGGSFQARPGPPLMNLTTSQNSGAARAVDFDGDGDVDFFIPGEGTNSSQRLVIRTLMNSGHDTFAAGYFPILPQSSIYSTHTYDGDDDGDLDVRFLYSTNYSGPTLEGMAANDGSGAFYLTTNNLVPGPLAGDFDNDGDLDRMVSELVSASPFKTRYRLYLKTGPNQYAPQPFVISEPGFAADFDGDGDLDYLAPTEETDAYGRVVSPRQWRFFRNNTDQTNLPPVSPAGLSHVHQTDDRVTFAWSPAADDHTPAGLITYNLRVGTTPGGIEVLAPCADPGTGHRWLSAAGNVGPLTFRDIRGLPSGTYYWSVQAIDGVFAASAWSPEQSFTLTQPSLSPLPDLVTPPGLASKPIHFSVTGGSSSVEQLTITAVADDPTLLPDIGLVITGTGTNRTLTITPANHPGDTDITVTVTDQAGFSAIRRSHVRVAWWDAQPQVQAGIPRNGQWRWLDVDLDGQLDLLGHLSTGNLAWEMFSYRNLGGAQFESVSNNLPTWEITPSEVGGSPGDAAPDLLEVQTSNTPETRLRIWQGTGAGFDFAPLNEFTNHTRVLAHLWLDMDNDGRQDLVYFHWGTPPVSNAPVRSLLFARGLPDGSFEHLPQWLAAYNAVSIAAADFDLDGDFDLVVSGQDYAANGQDPGPIFTRLYLNQGSGVFTSSPAGLPQTSLYNTSIADVDGDGWPDLLLNPTSPTSTNLPHLMRNVGASFVELTADLPTQLDKMTWGDLDNDGDPDLLGFTSAQYPFEGDEPYRAALFQNDGGVLTRTDTGLPMIVAYHASFADADNDGDLDLLISGATGWNQTGCFLCLNTSVQSNTPPPVPASLSVTPAAEGRMLQWTPAPDAESGTALTFNLRVGLTPGGSEVMSAAADPATGQRHLTGTGNIGRAPRWRMSLPDGIYYWSVQAVDAGFAGSPFAPEASFTHYHPTISGGADTLVYAAQPSAVIPFVVGDADSPADSLVLTAFSSNTNFLNGTNILFVGSGSNRTASITLPPGSVGASTVSVVVTDITGLAATNAFNIESSYFSDVTPVFSGSNYYNAHWADFDNDNDLDVFYGGFIYRNDGSNSFVQVSAPGPANRNGVVWGDYDRDGNLDFALSDGSTLKVFHNEGSGSFVPMAQTFALGGTAALAWGDYDSDGDLDLAVTQPSASRLYRNDNGSFVLAPTSLPPCQDGAVGWGDFDNDGDLDLLIAGLGSGSVDWRAEVYRNDGAGVFTALGAGFFGTDHSSVDWGDYDNDGWLDALVTGFNYGSYVLKVYHNNGDGTFTELNLGLQGVAFSDAGFADFDNDGWLDIHLNGCKENYCATVLNAIYRNNHDGTFSDFGAGLLPATAAQVGVGDYDNDGDLDLLADRLYRNNIAVANTPPTPPGTVFSQPLPQNDVLLSWQAAGDSETTNAPGLNYAVRVGTAPGAADYLSPGADLATGYRRVPERGAANTNFLLLRDVPKGEYYWSVQAIDPAFAGSPFSAEGSFSVTNSRPIISSISNAVTVPGRATEPIEFTIFDEETAPEDLTLTKLSLDPTLVPSENIVFGGSGSNRTVTITPAGNLRGNATIEVGVMDPGGFVATRQFAVAVDYLNYVGGIPIVVGASGWGDYDKDGDLDVFSVGPSQNSTTVYRNTGGFFTNQNFNLPAASYYQTPVDLAWLDFDNDDDLDFVQSGWILSGYQPVTLQFRNNYPTNAFSIISSNLPGIGVTNIANGAMAWADYDNDGDLDVLLSGDINTYHTPDGFTALFRNDRGVFTNSGVVLPQLVKGAAAWGDMDNDGDLDLVLAGQSSAGYNDVGTLHAHLFRNDGTGGFTELPTSFPGLTDCALAFADMDNDGDLDLAMAGTTTNSTVIARVYRNIGNGNFTNLNAVLTGVSYPSLAWGDFDNDGFRDLAISGSLSSSIQNVGPARVYRNLGGAGLTNVGLGLPSFMTENVSWGDYDNDGDLDLLSGTYLCRNNWNIPNSAPSTPTNLNFTALSNNAVELGWSPSTDGETSDPRGLNYNLRVGTTPGGGQIVSPLSDAPTGRRWLPQAGNAGQTNAWRLHNLTNGTYYWSVQAVDAGYTGSAFADEGTFTISHPVFSTITNRSVAPSTVVGPIPFTVSDPETAAADLVLAAYSSDTSLVPDPNLILGGTGSNRTITITPTPNRSGPATITLVATDQDGESGSTQFVVTYERFVDIGAGLSTLAGQVAWGDYDNDGDLDLAKGPQLYRNDGGGSFVNAATFGALASGVAVAWGDSDNDGDLDLLVHGSAFGGVLVNNGGESFTLTNPIGGNPNSSLSWGDYDNDGDQDFLRVYSNASYLFRNNGSNAFSQVSVGMPIVYVGSGAWGDYDNDGDLDVLVAGNNFLRIYRNNGNGSFTYLTPTFPGIYYACAAWGDYDNDGYLDFAVCGSTNNAASGVATRIYHSVYEPKGNTITFSLAATLQGVWRGSLAWCDYDGDGDPDLLVTGEAYPTTSPFIPYPVTRLYRNENGNFTDSGFTLPALRNSSAAWGDYDGDGSPDLALSGNNAAGAPVSQILRNVPGGETNLPPAAPTGLSALAVKKSVTLSWDAAVDPNQASGLSYNVRVGSVPGAGDILSPMSSPDGLRRVVAMGNANQRQFLTVTNLTGGIFYWSVQAVDSAYAGSPFAMEQPVTVSNIPPTALGQSIVTTEDTSKFVHLVGADPDNEPITFQISSPPLFGQLTGTPPNVTYVPQPNYFGLDQFEFRTHDRTTNSSPAAVRVQVTPVADLPGSSLGLDRAAGGPAFIQMQGEPWQSYRIEVSEDLVHWSPFTNILCTNLLTELMDLDAALYPQRFYRAAESSVIPAFNSSYSVNSNQFSFTIAGEAGRNYWIEASTNLVTWEWLSNVWMTNSSVPFLDPDAAQYPTRFYRIVAP